MRRSHADAIVASAPGRYVLEFDGVTVGRVVQTGAEFPRCVGTFEVADDLAESAPRIARLIASCRAATRIEDAWDGVSDYPTSPELEALEDFTSEMESDAWWLVESDGTREPIAGPDFRHDGTIIWVWDVSREAVPPGRP